LVTQPAGGASVAARHRRESESGQALLLALVVLVIAALAASLVAADLTLRERSMRDEAMRARLRAMLDGEMATALARLAHHRPQPPEVRQWAGGEVSARRQTVSAGRYRLQVRARYSTLQAAAEAVVVRPPGRLPRVVRFRRLATVRSGR
jgi:hypothetical protein